MNPIAENTKNDFLRTKDRLLTMINATPEDRLYWSPAPTARTPVQLFVHSINALQFLHESFMGKPVPMLSTAEFDAYNRALDDETPTKEEAVVRLEVLSNAFVAWLEQVSDETLETMWESPFGTLPMSIAITFPARHAEGHISQLEYVQTIYGDRVWH